MTDNTFASGGIVKTSRSPAFGDSNMVPLVTYSSEPTLSTSYSLNDLGMK